MYIFRYKRAVERLNAELKREPNVDEIAKEMNISASHVEKLLELQNNVASLEGIVNDDDSDTYDVIISSSESTPEEIMLKSNMIACVDDIFVKCGLKEQAIEVLKLRYGFDDGIQRTFEEVGRIMSLTRQRIEQIEKAAFKKILKSKYAVSLVEFMQNPDRALKCIEEKRRPKCKKNLIK